MKYFIITIIFLIFFSSCKKSDECLLIGDWRCIAIYENDNILNNTYKPYLNISGDGLGILQKADGYWNRDSIEWNYKELNNKLNISYKNSNYKFSAKIISLEYDNFWYLVKYSKGNEMLFNYKRIY